MDTKRKLVYRLAELDELRRDLQRPITTQELRLRQQLLERIDSFRATCPVIKGDVKQWIRKERGEIPDD